MPVTWKIQHISFTWLCQVLHSELLSEIYTPWYQNNFNLPEEPGFFHWLRKQSFSTE